MKVCLSEIAEFITDGTHGSPERVDSGIPVLSAQNVTGGVLSYSTGRYTTEAEYQLFKKRLDIAIGDVLLTIVGSIGRAAVVRESKPAVFQRSVAVIRPKRQIADPSYLFHLFHSNYFQSELCRNSNQSSQAGVYLGRLGSIEIPLPPLEEQRRIAAILDKAGQLTQVCTRLQATHRRMGESLFFDAFGDPRSNPFGLPSAMLGEIAECQLGKMLDKKRQSGSSQRPYLRNANIRWFDVDASDMLFMDIEDCEMDRFGVSEGDLLVCEGGEPGRAAIWRGESGVFGFQKALHRIRADKSRVLPEYLNWVLWILSQRGLLDDHITSATIAHLTREKLVKIRVLIPPLSSQERFARELGVLDLLGDRARSRSKFIRSLNSSLFLSLVGRGISQ
jgi:type I restriction enzyme S subunit